MLDLVWCGNFVHAYLILIRLIENVPLLQGFGVFTQRVDTAILFFLQPWLNHLQWCKGFKGSKLLMYFFKVLISFGKHCDCVSLNISNSASSISLTAILWGIYIVDNFRFRISHSCLNLKRHVICNTSFFSEERWSHLIKLWYWPLVWTRLLVSFSLISKNLSVPLSSLIELTCCSNKGGPFNHDWSNFNLLNRIKRLQKSAEFWEVGT